MYFGCTASSHSLTHVELQESSAEIYLHGAHVTSWKNNNGQVGDPFGSLHVSNLSDSSFPFFRNRFSSANKLSSSHPKPSGALLCVKCCEMRCHAHWFSHCIKCVCCTHNNTLVIAVIPSTMYDVSGKPFMYWKSLT